MRAQNGQIARDRENGIDGSRFDEFRQNPIDRRFVAARQSGSRFFALAQGSDLRVRSVHHLPQQRRSQMRLKAQMFAEPLAGETFDCAALVFGAVMKAQSRQCAERAGHQSQGRDNANHKAG